MYVHEPGNDPSRTGIDPCCAAWRRPPDRLDPSVPADHHSVFQRAVGQDDAALNGD
jgi:hypothetical protein